MTRKQGIELSQDYQSREPQHLQLLLDWLGITKNAFHYIVDQHRNQRVWKRDENWNWNRCDDFYRLLVDKGDPQKALDLMTSFTEFEITASGCSSDPTDRYILIGKGVN